MANEDFEMDRDGDGGSDSEPMVSLRDLRVSYGDREILHGISFDVLRGETMVILGGSGSGQEHAAAHAGRAGAAERG